MSLRSSIRQVLRRHVAHLHIFILVMFSNRDCATGLEPKRRMQSTRGRRSCFRGRKSYATVLGAAKEFRVTHCGLVSPSPSLNLMHTLLPLFLLFKFSSVYIFFNFSLIHSKFENYWFLFSLFYFFFLYGKFS